jgi:hypothetical protein
MIEILWLKFSIVQQFANYFCLKVGDFDYVLHHINHLMTFEVVSVLKPFLVFAFSLQLHCAHNMLVLTLNLCFKKM